MDRKIELRDEHQSRKHAYVSSDNIVRGEYVADCELCEVLKKTQGTTMGQTLEIFVVDRVPMKDVPL